MCAVITIFDVAVAEVLSAAAAIFCVESKMCTGRPGCVGADRTVLEHLSAGAACVETKMCSGQPGCVGTLLLRLLRSVSCLQHWRVCWAAWVCGYSFLQWLRVLALFAQLSESGQQLQHWCCW
jgi:hypothetical protein